MGDYLNIRSTEQFCNDESQPLLHKRNEEFLVLPAL